MCDFFLKQTLDTNLKPLFLIKSGYHIVPSHSTALPKNCSEASISIGSAFITLTWATPVTVIGTP